MTNPIVSLQNRYIKICLSILLVLASVLVLTGSLDNKGQEYTDQALTRSLLTFGVARALNGVISVAQGTEVAVQPAGVGVTFTPGEILDPINDLVERFSWVMLMSSASIGVQKTLLTMSAWHTFSVLVLVLIFLALVMLWLPKCKLPYLRQMVVKLALLAVVLRLSVPMIAIANEWVYMQFLAPQYIQATEQLQMTTNEISEVNVQGDVAMPSQEPETLWGKAQKIYKTTQNFDIEAKLEKYKNAVSDASEQLINLIVVFTIQTVLLPLVFISLLFALIKSLWFSALSLNRPQ